MDPVGVNSIETAALGRPFQLGMLYDCRRDALVPGIRLWSKEQLQQNISTKAQINTVFTVTASDSIEDKSQLLNIDGCLKLSFLGGLINVSGAASYLKDTKKSFSQQRLTLHYHSTTTFEELIMNHFPSGEMAHYDNDVATHVVTAVLYGADVCFVFDREVSSDEDKRLIAGEVKAALEPLKGISVGANINLNDNQKTAAQKFSCTFYGDFQLPCNPTSFEDAVKVFEDLPKLLGENQELAVPLRVWLYPLDRLFSRVIKFQHEISTGLSTDIESVIESLSTTEMKCSDLLTDTPALTFTAFRDKINDMKKNCYQCRLSLMKKLGSLLPKIRGKFIEDTALIDLLNDHEKSPFERSALEQWLKEKEEESDIIKSLITQLNDSEVKVEINLNKNLMNLEVKHLVSYTFTSLGRSDVLLSKQKTYLSSTIKGKNIEKSFESEHKSWLTPDIQKNMRNNLRIFKNLIDFNNSKSVKFIVASKEMENSPGSCVLLYENESNKAVCFTPPSKPDCPITEDVRCRQVDLKVSPPCPATEELTLLYKMKEEEDWKSQTVSQKQITVTLTDLRPDTEYSIKCAAVGKLNYTVDSDVTRLTIINQNLIKAKEYVIENLSWTENKCSVLLKNTSETTFTVLYKKIQDMQQNCQTYRQEFSERIKSVVQSVKACEKEPSALKDLLQAHDESPFNEKSLKGWITVKEEELNTINEFLRQLLDLGAEVNRRLDSYLSDIQLERVFCYTFSSLEQPDELLNEQKKYMNPQMMRNSQKTSDVASQSWLTGNIREKMREHLRIFKELMTSHSSQSTKFSVSIKDHEKHPGSCILLYENGCNEAVCFTPPSKPDCPITEDVRCRQVDLKVSPPCPATEELTLLYKMKKEKDWASQTVSQKQNTVTLTDLRPDTEYSIKCAAVGKLNYTVDSDVTRLTIINQNLIKAKESAIENLSWTENKCSVLLKNTKETNFTVLYKKIQDMQQNCQTYRQEFSERIKSVVQSVKACEKEPSALKDLLQAHDESPFNEKSLKEWITVKEEELNTINEFLRQLLDLGAEVNRRLDSYLSDIQLEHVFCYTFSSLEQPDELLNEQKKYMNPQMRRNPQKTSDVASQSWLTGNIREKMREHLRIFKELMTSHSSQSTKFSVSIKDHEKHPGSCILLYENGCNEAVCFTPPSKPDCPITEDVRCRQVDLKVSPPCPATEELTLLYKMKKEKDWTSQTVSQKQNTVTLTDLRPDTEYSIKCAAVGKLNYTVDSDVTRLTIINQNLIKAKESAIENLSWTENKCSVLLKNTKETTFTALYKKIQDMQQNCQTYRQEFSERIKSVVQSVKACEKEPSALKDLLQAHDESPFNEKSLKEWITVKEEELNTINEFLRQLLDLGAEVNRRLDSYLSDIQLEHVFCYTFSSLEQPDELLNEQKKYMNPQMRRNPQKTSDVASQSWLTGNIREKMREHLRIFKELMTSHSSQSTKFSVSIKDHEKHPGSCILLYENGCNEAVCFTPPSKPDCPITEDVRCRQVDLKVSPPCPATEELTLLYKMKKEKDWTSQTVSQKQNTVTLTDLRPDTEYSIKCAAVGKLNYITESDVTTVNTKKTTSHESRVLADSPERQKIEPELTKFDAIIKESSVIEEGPPTRYNLKPRTDSRDPSKPYIKVTFGEGDTKKPHKTILMVGETGTGKTTLINTMVNYMLGVKREHKVWFEITDDQSDRSSAHSQTSIITVYEFYLQESPKHLTIIDTPGYGDTRGVKRDKEITESLLSLSKSAEVVHEIDAVCLVIKATQNRLSDRQIYIFDAVQSLFGRDIAENIVLLLTHSDGMPPKNALTAVKEANIKCAVNDKNQPVYFLFNNRQSEPAEDEKHKKIQEQSWHFSFSGMKQFFKFLNTIKPKSLQMTLDVLNNREQLEANTSNLQSRVQMMELKQNELKQTQAALEQNKKDVKENKNFEYEVEVPYKEKIDIDPSKAKMAMCCTICQENCHYPGCWWVKDLSWCSVMKNNHCTVCTNKCHYSKHIKSAQIYVARKMKEKRAFKDLKKKYDGKISDGECVVKKLEEELQKLEKEKIKLVKAAFHCVETLQMIALKTDSLFILQHTDFLIEKLKEINEPEKAKTLENIKKRAGYKKHGATGYLTRLKRKYEYIMS